MSLTRAVKIGARDVLPAGTLVDDSLLSLIRPQRWKVGGKSIADAASRNPEDVSVIICYFALLDMMTHTAPSSAGRAFTDAQLGVRVTYVPENNNAHVTEDGTLIGFGPDNRVCGTVSVATIQHHVSRLLTGQVPQILSTNFNFDRPAIVPLQNLLPCVGNVPPPRTVAQKGPHDAFFARMSVLDDFVLDTPTRLSTSGPVTRVDLSPTVMPVPKVSIEAEIMSCCEFLNSAENGDTVYIPGAPGCIYCLQCNVNIALVNFLKHSHTSPSLLDSLPWDTASAEEAVEVQRDAAWSRSSFQKYLAILSEAAKCPSAKIPAGTISLKRALDSIGTAITEIDVPRPLILVRQVDAAEMSRSKLVRRGVQMVASQFNFLESVNSDYSQMSKYYHDWTQGPRASMAVPVALHRRDLTFASSNPQKIFSNCSFYRGGYLCPGLASPSELRSLRRTLESGDIYNLVTCIQSAVSVYGTPLTQVFCSAPSFQGCPMPVEDSDADMIARILLTEQYRLAARVAIHTSSSDVQTSLHLTLVGGGAFNNTPKTIACAVTAALEEIRGHNVIAYAHAWTSDDADLVAKIAAATPFPTPVRTMTREQFFE